MAFPVRLVSLCLLCLLFFASGCSKYTLVVHNHAAQTVLVRVELPDPGGLRAVGGTVAAGVLHPHDEAIYPFQSGDSVPVAMVWLGSFEDGRLLFKRALNPGKTRLEVRPGPPGEPPAVAQVR